MKRTTKIKTFNAFGLASLLFLAGPTVRAQQGPPQGGFDPQQMRQRMMQRVREQFEVSDDSEWKIISERLTKVMDARRAANSGPGPGGFGFFGVPGGGPPPNFGGGQGGPGGPPPNGDNSNGPGGAGPGGPPPGGPGPGVVNREPNPELEALQKAIEAKAPSAELKAKMAELKAARAKKQADLEKAREDLRQVLSVRQEAVATMMGLL
jgi:hypothetical protein